MGCGREGEEKGDGKEEEEEKEEEEPGVSSRGHKCTRPETASFGVLGAAVRAEMSESGRRNGWRPQNMTYMNERDVPRFPSSIGVLLSPAYRRDVLLQAFCFAEN